MRVGITGEVSTLQTRNWAWPNGEVWTGSRFQKGAEGAETAYLGHSTEAPPLDAVAKPPKWVGISETDILTWVGISETDAFLLRPLRQPLDETADSSRW